MDILLTILVGGLGFVAYKLSKQNSQLIDIINQRNQTIEEIQKHLNPHQIPIKEDKVGVRDLEVSNTIFVGYKEGFVSDKRIKAYKQELAYKLSQQLLSLKLIEEEILVGDCVDGEEWRLVMRVKVVPPLNLPY